jgi:hypothetical protein
MEQVQNVFSSAPTRFVSAVAEDEVEGNGGGKGPPIKGTIPTRSTSRKIIPRAMRAPLLFMEGHM